MNIHTTAIIGEGAKIHKSVKIAPYAIIGENVTIGKGTTIGSHAVINGETIIGENNTIFHSVSIGVVPQDLKFNGEKTKTVIGNNNTIREFVTIHRGTEAALETKIGDNNLFMVYSHVAHDCIVGDNCILANSATLAGHVQLGDFVIVGGLTPVHQFVKIGSYAMIGGASAVNQDIVPFVIAEGNKAVTHGINIVGLRRKGFSREDMSNLKDAYKTIFRSGLKLVDATQSVKEEYPDDKNIEYLLDFISKSERGICR